MKHKIPTALLILLIISLAKPVFSTTFIKSAMLPSSPILTSVQAGITDPIDYGITDLRAKVNATYARGDCWSVWYNSTSGTYLWRSEPMWIWNGSRYVPYIFNTSTECITIKAGLIGAKIYRDKAVFYDPNLTRLAVERENWAVFRWNELENKWKPVCATLERYFVSVHVTKSASYVNVTASWVTEAGNLTIIYHFKERLKHTTLWTPNYAGKYAVLQIWNGTQYGKIKLTNATIMKRGFFING